MSRGTSRGAHDSGPTFFGVVLIVLIGIGLVILRVVTL